MNELIQFIYPGIKLGIDYMPRDDGAGVYIERWNDPRPQPTQAELDAAVIPLQKAKKLAEIDDLVAKKIASVFGYEPRSYDLIARQLNLNARVNYLNDDAKTRELTSQEISELAAIKSLFDRVVAIRSYKPAVVARVNSGDFDITTGWPE